MDYQRLYCDLKTELALEINNLKRSNNETEAQVARSLENIYNRNTNLYDKMIEEDRANVNPSPAEMMTEAISTIKEMVEKRNTDTIKIPDGPPINVNLSPEEIEDIKALEEWQSTIDSYVDSYIASISKNQINI